MSIFSKLLSRSPKFRQFEPDDDVDAKSVRQFLKKGDWASVRGALARLNDSGDREFVINCAANWPGRPSFLEQWTKEEPNCAQAYLMRGAHSIQWAWEARTGSRAESVPQKA